MTINEAIFEVITTPFTEDKIDETPAFKVIRKCGYIIGHTKIHPVPFDDEVLWLYCVESRKTHKYLYACSYPNDPTLFSLMGSFRGFVNERVGEPTKFDFANYLDTPERNYSEPDEDYKPTLYKYEEILRVRERIARTKKNVEKAEQDLQTAKNNLKWERSELKSRENELKKLLAKYNLS